MSERYQELRRQQVQKAEEVKSFIDQANIDIQRLAADMDSVMEELPNSVIASIEDLTDKLLINISNWNSFLEEYDVVHQKLIKAEPLTEDDIGFMRTMSYTIRQRTFSINKAGKDIVENLNSRGYDV